MSDSTTGTLDVAIETHCMGWGQGIYLSMLGMNDGRSVIAVPEHWCWVRRAKWGVHAYTHEEERGIGQYVRHGEVNFANNWW